MIDERAEVEKKMMVFEEYVAALVIHASSIAFHGPGYVGSARRESEVSEARNKVLDMIIAEGVDGY